MPYHFNIYLLHFRQMLNANNKSNNKSAKLPRTDPIAMRAGTDRSEAATCIEYVRRNMIRVRSFQTCEEEVTAVKVYQEVVTTTVVVDNKLVKIVMVVVAFVLGILEAFDIEGRFVVDVFIVILVARIDLLHF